MLFGVNNTKTNVNQHGPHNHFRPEEKNAKEEFKSIVIKSIDTNPTTLLNKIYKEENQKHDAKRFTVHQDNQFRRNMFRENI